jgi:hypothetical protein
MMATFKKIPDSVTKMQFPAGTLEMDSGVYVVDKMVYIDRIKDGVASQQVRGRIVAGPYENLEDAGDELLIYMMELDL